MLTYLTKHDAKHRILDVEQPIRPFSHAPQVSQFICHAKNVVYDVAYPMHVWRLFINLEIHAREARWPRCTLCSSRAHVSRRMLHGYEKDPKKGKKKEDIEAFVMEGVGTSTSTLSNGLKRSLCSYEVDSLRID